MIIFDGIKAINKITVICFINENKEKIEVPIDLVTADRISKYLSRISPPANMNFTKSNDSIE